MRREKQNNDDMQKFSILTASLMLLLVACRGAEKSNAKAQETVWWQSLEPDLVIGPNDFYARKCSVIRVDAVVGESEVLFKVPSHPLKTCKHRDNVLTYDGEYMVLDVCVMTFGAGGCSGGRYRSADYRHWEEEIGVTWIKGAAYEAWRNVGSKSSKADSVKKIIKE